MNIFEATEPTTKNLARARDGLKTCSDADLIAMKTSQPTTAMGAMSAVLLAEREAGKQEKCAALASTRHAELLAEVRLPHWSVAPAFLVGVFGAVAGLIAAAYGYLSYVQQSPSAGTREDGSHGVSQVQPGSSQRSHK